MVIFHYKKNEQSGRAECDKDEGLMQLA